MNKIHKRCSICILPDKTPNIAFDANGVCSYCKTYERFQFQGESKLQLILDAHRNKTKKYECIVTISGGRDSAYTLLKVVKDYKMKTLAVNYENPFTDERAKTNIANMVKVLGVDILRFKHKNQTHESCFKNNLLAWFKNPSPAMVPMICIGCKLIWKTIMHIAKEHEVTLIVNGGNPYEYTSFKKELLDVSRDANLGFYYVKYIKGLIKESLRNLAYLKPKYVPILLKGYLYAHHHALGPRVFAANIEFLDLFHFICWNENEVISRISEELHWDYPSMLHSTWRFDCKIAHLKDYMYMKTLGITEKDDFYAKMVREGLMTRSDALGRLALENTIHEDIIAEILQQQGLAAEYFLT